MAQQECWLHFKFISGLPTRPGHVQSHMVLKIAFLLSYNLQQPLDFLMLSSLSISLPLRNASATKITSNPEIFSVKAIENKKKTVIEISLNQNDISEPMHRKFFSLYVVKQVHV